MRQLLHCFSLCTTYAQVSIAAFTWRLRPNELLCQRSSGCSGFRCWHPSRRHCSSARGHQPEQAQQKGMWGGSGHSSSQSSALFPIYFHQQCQPRCQALHRAWALCHQGWGTPALNLPELELPGCNQKRWLSGTLCKPDWASYKTDPLNPPVLTNSSRQAGSQSRDKLAPRQDFCLWARGTPRVCTARYPWDNVASEA